MHSRCLFIGYFSFSETKHQTEQFKGERFVLADVLVPSIMVAKVWSRTTYMVLTQEREDGTGHRVTWSSSWDPPPPARNLNFPKQPQ